MKPRDAKGPSSPGAKRPPREKPGQLGSRQIHKGRVVDLAMDQVRFPNGSTVELELVRHSGASAVVPIIDDSDPADPEILLLRQFRYAAGGELYEIPAGRPDSDSEPWETVARRELEEETGFRPRTLEYLTGIWTTPGFTDELIHIFLGRDLEEGSVNTDADEFLSVERMPLSRALELIDQGQITDAKSICGLLLTARRLHR
ncbi:MAG TPA: NUDIX hydrolase [Longimicrobiales bacterium]